jgi:hypothetical protein
MKKFDQLKEVFQAVAGKGKTIIDFLLSDSLYQCAVEKAASVEVCVKAKDPKN